jgi:hypothetical protein
MSIINCIIPRSSFLDLLLPQDRVALASLLQTTTFQALAPKKATLRCRLLCGDGKMRQTYKAFDIRVAYGITDIICSGWELLDGLMDSKKKEGPCVFRGKCRQCTSVSKTSGMCKCYDRSSFDVRIREGNSSEVGSASLGSGQLVVKGVLTQNHRSLTSVITARKNMKDGKRFPFL